MENEKEINSLEKIENFVRKNKNILLIILTLIIFVLIGVGYLNYYQKSKNEKGFIVWKRKIWKCYR